MEKYSAETRLGSKLLEMMYTLYKTGTAYDKNYLITSAVEMITDEKN